MQCREQQFLIISTHSLADLYRSSICSRHWLNWSLWHAHRVHTDLWRVYGFTVEAAENFADPPNGTFVVHWHDEGETREKDLTSPNRKMTCFEIQMRSSWCGNRRDKGTVSSSCTYIMGQCLRGPIVEHDGKCLNFITSWLCSMSVW